MEELQEIKRKFVEKVRKMKRSALWKEIRDEITSYWWILILVGALFILFAFAKAYLKGPFFPQ